MWLRSRLRLRRPELLGPAGEDRVASGHLHGGPQVEDAEAEDGSAPGKDQQKM